MLLAHLLATILAAWRLTELITHDRILESARRRFPGYLWSCPRCVSVWAGVFSTTAFIYLPWFNWPFALSSLALIGIRAFTSSLETGKQILIEVDPNGTIGLKRTDFNAFDTARIMGRVIQSMDHVPASRQAK
jgi:hypothetical protein